MTIKDRVAQQREGQGMMDGAGKYLAYVFFEGQIHPSMFFAEVVLEPEAYGGYHRHDDHDTVLYVLSGVGEHYQDGERRALTPGDAVLIRRGHAHAVKNTGDEGLRIIEFGAVLDNEYVPDHVGVRLPLPDDIGDWA